MREYTGVGYPHDNLNAGQRAALDRLSAPRFELRRYWATVTVTDPDGKGVMFYPRIRRTWTFYVKGYTVITVAGKLREDRDGRWHQISRATWPRTQRPGRKRRASHG